ncbi:uncharacterized protein LOC111277140 isoform X2 [Durio zibethinus]|uniref:Uncharacterized protein LOC111277140 isoform X2 n=1 Tax=Durio zibethinus TaxID=66656 RepID=A0A6P5WTF5_DURZI|nr:uncharacterized protein LOC111277140 isoform X2 [Durio zibethinus]
MLTSEAEREISGSASVGDGYDDDYDNPESGSVVSHTRISDFDGRACKRDFVMAKVKQVVLFPFAKFNKKKKKKTKTSAKMPSFSSSGKRVGSGGGFCSGFCCTQPRTLESPADSKTSDPNDPTFTYEMLKALIESNHFYSEDCNPHSVYFRLIASFH